MKPSESITIEKIKSRGYWQIEIKPLKYPKTLLKLGQCREFIETSQVRLRGWNYPHLGQDEGGYYNGNNFVGSFVDWRAHCEAWRMYTSGQFIHYLGFWEDWIDHPPYNYEVVTRGIKLPNVKEILMTLFTVTEIFLFASRLSQFKIFDKFLDVSLNLKNTNNRQLFFEDQFRTLLHDYTCKIDEIKFNKKISIEEIAANHSELALDATIEIFEKFDWQMAEGTRNALKQDQVKFLKGIA